MEDVGFGTSLAEEERRDRAEYSLDGRRELHGDKYIGRLDGMAQLCP